ncbi:MAG: DUF4388 domain-containing protein [Trueperaceae bacterium]|nr:DUF4388 domain-containing protein [Trueperaceae bacterium]
MLQGLSWNLTVAVRPEVMLQALNNSYEAIFCDEELKGATVIGIQKVLQQRSPQTPFYYFRDLQSNKPTRFVYPPTAVLPFPPLLTQLPKPDSFTDDPSAKKTEVPFEGNSSMIALIDVLHSMGMDKRSALIQLDKGKVGLIYVNRGLIEDALYFNENQRLKGLKALGRLIQLEDTPYRVMHYMVPGQLSVKLPVDTALTEASRIADEEQRYGRIMDEIKSVCPSIEAIAIGYPMASSPSQGIGDSAKIFSIAKALMEKSREVIKGRINEFFITTDATAYALIHLDEGNLLIASAPVRDRNLLQKALKFSEVASYA